MKILEVIPIARGITKETLSYFTGSDISEGSIVKVPLRKRIIPALVISSKDASESKSEIKGSSFALKKVEKIKSFNLFKKEFIEAAETAAEYFAGTVGAILNSVVPKIFFENADKFKVPDTAHTVMEGHAEKLVLQSNDEDRYANYKSIIREIFAKGQSVFFCLPTVQDIKTAEENLQKGIEKYTFVLHGYIQKKEITEKIKKILAEKHPVLVIATAGYMALPKDNIGAIILDKENSRAYKTQSRPYVDYRVFAEILAKKINSKIIFGDLMLRAETIYRHKKGELHEVSPLKFRSLTTSSQKLIDMKKNDEGDKEETKFRIFSPELEEKVKNNPGNNEHMFIFVARRGLSPSTVCADCSSIVKCSHCEAHIVLHRGTENFFLCHKCGERRTAEEKCKNCGGWRLTTLGIGAELVEEKLKEILPKEKIFRIDSDKTPDHQKALQAAEKFYNSPEGVLVGTEMSLLYLTKKIENSGIVSMDTFFSVPDFRINERIMNILLKIRAITERSMIIQTRDTKQKVFDYAMGGNLVDFYRDEIDDRKRFGYPPFSTLIKISISGKKDEVLKSAEIIKRIVEPYEMEVFPAFIPQGKSILMLNSIIRIPESSWPDHDLSVKLKNLPPNIFVNVDPDSLI